MIRDLVIRKLPSFHSDSHHSGIYCSGSMSAGACDRASALGLANGNRYKQYLKLYMSKDVESQIGFTVHVEKYQCATAGIPNWSVWSRDCTTVLGVLSSTRRSTVHQVDHILVQSTNIPIIHHSSEPHLQHLANTKTYLSDGNSNERFSNYYC